MSEHNIYYAFCKWSDRESVENWTSLYNDITVDGAKKTCDAFGRFFGEPYFGHERPIAFEESIGDDARYYCFITSDSEVIVYKETGIVMSSGGGGSSGDGGAAQTWAEGTDEEVAELGGEHSAKGWAEVADQTIKSNSQMLSMSINSAGELIVSKDGMDIVDFDIDEDGNLITTITIE